MRPYSSKIALCGLSCSCLFPGTWVLGQFGEIGPKYLQIMTRVQTKSNPKTSALYFTSNETLLQCQGPLICGLSFIYIPISQVLWNCCNLGKLHWNTPNHSQGHMKSNPKSSALHLTSNNVLLLCQGHLRVSYTCLRGIQALGQFGEKGPKYSQII